MTLSQTRLFNVLSVIIYASSNDNLEFIYNWPLCKTVVTFLENSVLYKKKVSYKLNSKWEKRGYVPKYDRVVHYYYYCFSLP